MPAREKHSEPAGGRLRIQRKLLDLDSLATQGPFCLEPLVVADISVASYAHARTHWVLHVSRCLHMIMNELAIWDEDVYKLGSTFLLGVPYADQGKVGVVREDPPHALHRTCPPQHRPDKPLPEDLHHAIGCWFLMFPPQTENAVIFAILFGRWACHLPGVLRSWKLEKRLGSSLSTPKSSECVGQSAGVLKRHGGALSACWRKGVRSVTNEDDAAGRRAG